MGKLENEKHELFCHKYIELKFNGTRAYLEVYPDSSEEAARSSASDLLANPNVKQRIDELKKELYKRSIMSTEEKMKWLCDVISGEIKDEILLKDTTIEAPARLETKLKAMDTLNKMSGEYVTKVEANTTISSPVQGLSKEELEKIIKNG